MTKARKLLVLLVAVLVASCFAVAHCAIPGKVQNRTLLQAGPGAGAAAVTTLPPQTSLQVVCRVQSAIVIDDPWWLKVTVPSQGNLVGWVADYYVNCGNVGNCIVDLC